MWYGLFCLTTALAALYELFLPSVREVSTINPEGNIAQHKILTLFSLTIFSIMWAPLVFFPCVIPTYGERFRKALVNGLLSSS